MQKNDTLLELASRHRIATRTRQFSLGSKATPENLKQRMKKLLETGGWDVAMIHGIHYGYDAFPDPTLFWDHLDRVKALEDQVWVGTFEEVAAYIAEREATTLEIISGGKGKLLVKPTCSFNSELFKEPLTAILHRSGIKELSVIQDHKELDCILLADKALFNFDPQGGTIQIKFR